MKGVTWIATNLRPRPNRETLGSDGGDLRPHPPEILCSTDEARALEIPAGAGLQDHQVHEGAWVSVIDGEVGITTTGEGTMAGRSGLMLEFAPGERHAVRALTPARLPPLSTPWPGDGDPGTVPLGDKATVRQRAAERRPRS